MSKIYHITHVDNLASIAAGDLVSDAEMIARGGPIQAIGMSRIKQRRLKIPVPCHAGSFVGDYVPFYLCPRSIMLFLIHRANHADLTYRGGQGSIVHLEADLNDVVTWADNLPRRWAFSLSNAGSYYAQFRSSLADLPEIDWSAVRSTDFREPSIKEGKQAEFLVRDSFPWHLFERIGVCSDEARERTLEVLEGTTYPPVVVMPNWYY